jgi:hypothetical protein
MFKVGNSYVSPVLSKHENSVTKMILDLTKKESQLLDDVFTYMIDYINDDCFSNSDRKSFDSIYSKLKEKSK